MVEARFRTADAKLASLFEECSSTSSSIQLPARNFLLDEGVSSHRADSYVGQVAPQVHSQNDWPGAHATYLATEVFLARPPNQPPRTVNPRRTSICPQTFRELASFEVFGRADRRLQLLRLIDANPIARILGRSVDDLVTAASTVIEARAASTSPDPASLSLFEAALSSWNRQCDLRPCFASFYLDHDDLFGQSPSEDQPGWADEMRDRLGLSHLDPSSGSTQALLVFRYSVSDVPKHKGLDKSSRPLATPTVLDGSLNPAFCPAPHRAPSGHTVHLQAGRDQPCREVVHPYLDFEAEHLFRVGKLTRSVPNELLPARAVHISALRRTYQRDDYARHTDPES